jgi:hypothetical protein
MPDSNLPMRRGRGSLIDLLEREKQVVIDETFLFRGFASIKFEELADRALVISALTICRLFSCLICSALLDDFMNPAVGGEQIWKNRYLEDGRRTPAFAPKLASLFRRVRPCA